MFVCPKLLGLCSVNEANGSKGMELNITGLETAGQDELLEQWRSVIGRPPPKHISRILLIQILVWEQQSGLYHG